MRRQSRAGKECGASKDFATASILKLTIVLSARPGTYSNETGLRKSEDCLACPPGWYCDGLGLTAPRGLCDPGFYCSGRSNTSAPQGLGSLYHGDIGGPCLPGGYCPIGSSHPTHCPSGRYNNRTGSESQEACEPCDPGFFCSGTNNAYPTGPCAAGYYCTGGARVATQHLAPKGHYTLVGAASPVACPPGTYNDRDAQSDCMECEAGFYCPISGMNETSTFPCPAGSYCEPGSVNPRQCPKGTYNPVQAQINASSCVLCDGGHYCLTEGLEHPTALCEAGYYCAEGAASPTPTDGVTGDVCPPGAYCPEGSASPRLCPPGTYYPTTSNRGNETSIYHEDPLPCLACPPGRACTQAGLVEPDADCEAGFFCRSTSRSTTPVCLKNSPSGECLFGVCPEGHFCPPRTVEPIPCMNGTFMNHTGAEECYDCPRGFFCDPSDPRHYFDCPVGHYCPARTDATIPKCPAGRFGARTLLGAVDECTVCPGGSYCSTAGLAEPDGQCQAGYYCPPGSRDQFGMTADSVEHECPAGSYCPQNSTVPLPCPPGTYNPITGLTDVSECLPCDNGYFCFGYGLTRPTGRCHGGFYCNRGNQDPAPYSGVHFDTARGLMIGGDICPQGTFCGNGTWLPNACAAGTYAQSVGQTECDLCPAGYFCDGNTTTYHQSPCPPGYFCPPGTQYNTQFPCPAGKYSNHTRRQDIDDCVDAPAGFYVSGTGQSSITGQCEAGFYCLPGSATPTPNCTDGGNDLHCPFGGICEPGTYCPSGSGYPRPCEPGSYCLGGSGELTGECAPGFYCVQVRRDAHTRAQRSIHGHAC